ncbi:MAG: DUF1990 family protein [Actinomadura sp.]
MFQRRYTVRMSPSTMSAARLINRLCEDLNAASPVEFAVFDKTSGASQHLDVGDEYEIHMPGPWSCPVRVVERTPLSFRFATLQGHMEAGEIEFRATDTREGGLVFTIESWARSADRLADVLYDRLLIAKEMQLHMWTHFCTRVADLSGGRITSEVEVHTERAEVPGDTGLHPPYVTRAVAAAFTKVFSMAARLHGVRPLYPSGLVFDATLHLHGTSQCWGVPLLDARAELQGKARLFRAVGLPLPLPDVLGLRLRWWQPTDTASGSGGGAPEDPDAATAELLLATTGHTVLGRRLLRPATRWSPAFYGSLLPYEAGDHHVMLGAVAQQTRNIPAGNEALACAVDERPLLLELVMATEFGPWERFGELLLTGPAQSADSEPMRFDPAWHPIPGS